MHTDFRSIISSTKPSQLTVKSHLFAPICVQKYYYTIDKQVSYYWTVLARRYEHAHSLS